MKLIYLQKILQIFVGMVIPYLIKISKSPSCRRRGLVSLGEKGAKSK
jgi:hypothetical protein